MSLSLLVGLAFQVGDAVPAIIERAHLDPREDVSFHALALPETVFVGQAAIYELGVFISDEMRQRLRKNPEFVPPELQSVLAYDLRETHGARTIVRDGKTYEVHVFRRALFPVVPGRIVIPAARLSYQVPLGTSFFSREETRLLTAEPVTIVAIPPPTAGRPANWTGAVGDLRISTIVSAGRMRVGDPFVVTLRLSGEGNVHLLPRPAWTASWASIVPGGERVVIDSQSPVVRGTKEFDWLVTPTVDGPVTMPAVQYAFFDPTARAYRSTASAARPLRIDAGGLASADTTARPTVATPALPLRARWSTPLPDAPDGAPWFWLLLAAVPIPVLVRGWRVRPRTRAATAPEGALHALAGAGSSDAAQVRVALRRALDARLGSSPIPWADTTALRRFFRHHGVTARTVDDAMALLARIDAATFGGSVGPALGVAANALSVFDAIDREARSAARAAVLRRSTALTLILALAVVSAQSPLSPRALFDHAVATYATGATRPAALDFLVAAQASPAAAAAWVDAGTASWTSGDTATAVAGWQHALRLDPLDADVRARLSLVGADSGAGRDVVWPLPRRLPAWVALALWMAGWIAMWRRRRSRLAYTALAAAVALLAVSRVQHERLTDRTIAVVAQPAALRTLPALVAEANAAPLTGELVKVLERRGVWARVVAAGGREGWIDAALLLDLDGRPLRE